MLKKTIRLALAGIAGALALMLPPLVAQAQAPVEVSFYFHQLVSALRNHIAGLGGPG